MTDRVGRKGGGAVPASVVSVTIAPGGGSIVWELGWGRGRSGVKCPGTDPVLGCHDEVCGPSNTRGRAGQSPFEQPGWDATRPPQARRNARTAGDTATKKQAPAGTPEPDGTPGDRQTYSSAQWVPRRPASPFWASLGPCPGAVARGGEGVWRAGVQVSFSPLREKVVCEADRMRGARCPDMSPPSPACSVGTPPPRQVGPARLGQPKTDLGQARGPWGEGSSCDQSFRSAGTFPPFSSSFLMTCLCSQTFIVAESSLSPV